MDPSDEWCYFEDVVEAEGTYCTPRLEPHYSQRIAVCNHSGFIVIAKDSKIVLFPTRLIEDYIKGTEPPQFFEKDFSETIDIVAVNETGSLLAVACRNILHILGTRKWIRGLSQTYQALRTQSPIRWIEWNRKTLGILQENGSLDIYLKDKLMFGIEKIKCFGFLKSRDRQSIACSDMGIIIIDNKSGKILSQHPLEEVVPIGIKEIGNSMIVIFGFRGEGAIIQIYSLDPINLLKETSDPDLTPYTLPDIYNDLPSKPIVAYFEYLPSRNTLIVSSSGSSQINIVYDVGEDAEIYLWDEIAQWKGKVPWAEGNDFEDLMRGFGLITNFKPHTETFEFTIKDDEFKICYPPMVVFIGSNGKIYLKKYIDLRSEYLNESLIKEGRSLKDISDDEDEGKSDSKGKVEEQKSQTDLLKAKQEEQKTALQKPETSLFNPKPMDSAVQPQKKLDGGISQFGQASLVNPFSKPEEKAPSRETEENKKSEEISTGLSKLTQKTLDLTKPTDLKTSNPFGAPPFGTQIGSFIPSKPEIKVDAFKGPEQVKENPFQPKEEGTAKTTTQNLFPIQKSEDSKSTAQNPFSLSNMQSSSALSKPEESKLTTQFSFGISDNQPGKEETSKKLFNSQPPVPNSEIAPKSSSQPLFASLPSQPQPKPEEIKTLPPEIALKSAEPPKPKPVDTTILKQEKEKLINFLDTTIQETSTSFSQIKSQQINDTALYDIKKLITDSQKTISQSKQKIFALSQKLDDLTASHIENKMDADAVKNIFEMAKTQLEAKNDLDEGDIDPRLIRSIEEFECRANTFEHYFRVGLEKIIKMIRSQRNQLGVKTDENTNMLRVTRKHIPETKKKSVECPKEIIDRLIVSRIEQASRVINELDIKVRGLKKALRPSQQKRFAFEDVENSDEEEKEGDNREEVVDFRDPAEQQRRFKDWIRPQTIQSKIEKPKQNLVTPQNVVKQPEKKLQSEIIKFDTIKEKATESPQISSKKKSIEHIMEVAFKKPEPKAQIETPIVQQPIKASPQIDSAPTPPGQPAQSSTQPFAPQKLQQPSTVPAFSTNPLQQPTTVPAFSANAPKPAEKVEPSKPANSGFFMTSTSQAPQTFSSNPLQSGLPQKPLSTAPLSQSILNPQKPTTTAPQPSLTNPPGPFSASSILGSKPPNPIQNPPAQNSFFMSAQNASNASKPGPFIPSTQPASNSLMSLAFNTQTASAPMMSGFGQSSFGSTSFAPPSVPALNLGNKTFGTPGQPVSFGSFAQSTGTQPNPAGQQPFGAFMGSQQTGSQTGSNPWTQPRG